MVCLHLLLFVHRRRQSFQVGGICKTWVNLPQTEKLIGFDPLFFGGAPIHTKMSGLEGPMPGLEDPKGPRSYAEGLPM